MAPDVLGLRVYPVSTSGLWEALASAGSDSERLSNGSPVRRFTVGEVLSGENCSSCSSIESEEKTATITAFLVGIDVSSSVIVKVIVRVLSVRLHSIQTPASLSSPSSTTLSSAPSHRCHPSVYLWWWLSSGVRGFWEHVRPFILRLHFISFYFVLFY